MLLALGATLVAAAGLFQARPLTAADAHAVAAMVRDLAAADAGGLWGRSLDGPLLLVERGTGLTFATAPDSGGLFVPEGTLFRGRLPAGVNPANTALDWSGRRWTMVLWPLPADPARRRRLLAHELWHRIQLSLGFPLHSPANPHLDAGPGRVWLRLEGRALAEALRVSGNQRKSALLDALRFRAARAVLDRAADSSEAALERNEGLAEYTGYRLSGAGIEQQAQWAIEALGVMDTAATIARSFAYATGPAYGLLLDELRPGWRRELAGGGTLAGLARQAVGGNTDAAGAAADRYGGSAIRAEETLREERRVARLAELRRQFVEGPRLELPLGEATQLGFDPGRVESLPDAGTVYGGLRLSDAWGVLDATAGAGLVATDWRTAVVSVGADFAAANPAGPGWRLVLQAGWIIEAGGSPNHWRVVRAR